MSSKELAEELIDKHLKVLLDVYDENADLRDTIQLLESEAAKHALVSAQQIESTLIAYYSRNGRQYAFWYKVKTIIKSKI